MPWRIKQEHGEFVTVKRYTIPIPEDQMDVLRLLCMTGWCNAYLGRATSQTESRIKTIIRLMTDKLRSHKACPHVNRTALVMWAYRWGVV